MAGWLARRERAPACFKELQQENAENCWYLYKYEYCRWKRKCPVVASLGLGAGNK